MVGREQGFTNIDYINAAVCFDSVLISQRLAHGWGAIRGYQGDFNMRHALGVILLFVVGSANAATIVYAPDGDVTGIGGLDIGGTLYNVDFEAEQSAFSTFGGEVDFWQFESEALNASSEINDLLNAANAILVNNENQIRYQVNHGGEFSPRAVANVNASIVPPNWLVSGSGVKDLTLTTAWSVVPLPAAVWLFGSALAGLGWFRRRQTA
jgi:hypothetical protein